MSSNVYPCLVNERSIMCLRNEFDKLCLDFNLHCFHMVDICLLFCGKKKPKPCSPFNLPSMALHTNCSLLSTPVCFCLLRPEGELVIVISIDFILEPN